MLEPVTPFAGTGDGHGDHSVANRQPNAGTGDGACYKRRPQLLGPERQATSGTDGDDDFLLLEPALRFAQTAVSSCWNQRRHLLECEVDGWRLCWCFAAIGYANCCDRWLRPVTVTATTSTHPGNSKLEPAAGIATTDHQIVATCTASCVGGDKRCTLPAQSWNQRW